MQWYYIIPLRSMPFQQQRLHIVVHLIATGTATVTQTGTDRGTYTAPAGVVINAATGELILQPVHRVLIRLLILHIWNLY